MKKLFTLIAATLMVVGAQAQSQFKITEAPTTGGTVTSVTNMCVGNLLSSGQ